MVRSSRAAATLLFTVLAFALLHAHSVVAQGSVISFGFTELTAGVTPTPAPTQQTSKPKKTTPAPIVKTATPIVTTAAPVIVTVAPVTTPPPVETPPPLVTSSAPTASPNSASMPPVTTAPPSDTPVSSEPTPSAPVTTAPPSPPATLPPSHDCNAATVTLVTDFYEHNNVLEGTCAAANDYYRFPFEGVPSRAQLVNMSKTSACTVLMQALLQLVASECDFKRVPLRSTAEAILQLARSLKQVVGEASDTSTAVDAAADALLPSSDAIVQAIQTRRKELLNITASVDSTSNASASATMSSTKATKAAGAAAWTITPGIMSVNDDGQHILMDKNLLVVGTYRDKPHTSSSSSSSGSSGSNEDGAAVVSPKSAPKDTLEVDVASTRSDAPTRSVSSIATAVAVAWSVLLLMY